MAPPQKKISSYALIKLEKLRKMKSNIFQKHHICWVLVQGFLYWEVMEGVPKIAKNLLILLTWKNIPNDPNNPMKTSFLAVVIPTVPFLF